MTPYTLARPRLALFTLWLLVFAAAGQIIVVAPLLPRITAQMGVPSGNGGLLVTVYAVTLSLFTLVVGPVSDRIGRRRVILGGTAAMAVVLLAHGLARSFESLLVLRALAGAAGGVLSGASVAYVGDTFPPERRGGATAWVMSGFAVGQILGIPAAVWLSDWGGFRAPFVAFGAVLALVLLVESRTLPQPRGVRSRERLTLRRALAGYGALLRRRDTAAAAGVYALLFLGVGLFVVYFPTWLEEHLGFTPRAVAAVYVLGGLANVLTGPPVGRFSDRVGRKPVIVAASLGVGTLMALAPLAALAPTAAFAVFFGIMALAAARIAPLQALLTEMVPAERRGSFMSLTTATGNAGFAAGSALAGALYAGVGFTGNALAAGAAAVVGAGLVAWRLPRVPSAGGEPARAARQVSTVLAGPTPEAGHMTEAAAEPATEPDAVTAA